MHLVKLAGRLAVRDTQSGGGVEPLKRVVPLSDGSTDSDCRLHTFFCWTDGRTDHTGTRSPPGSLTANDEVGKSELIPEAYYGLPYLEAAPLAYQVNNSLCAQ